MISLSRRAKIGMRVDVVEGAEQLLLGEHVAVGAVAADADADGARSAALSLRLPDGVQNALAHAFEVAVGLAHVLQIAGSEYWMFLFSQPPPLRISFTSISILVPLLEVDDGGLGAEIVAAVFAGERVDRIGAQLAAPRGFGDGFLDRVLERDLVDADRRVHDEGGHAGVLADGTLVLRAPCRYSKR